MASRKQKNRNGKIIRNRSVPFFANEICFAFGVDESWVHDAFYEYQACPRAWEYLSGLASPNRQFDGYGKSLDIAEGFAVWALVKWLQPQTIVELGVQFGISARLWKEALKYYVPAHQLILCDLVDKRRFIGDDESTFLEGDARKTLPALFHDHQIDILHNDAHPFNLISWSLEHGIKDAVRVFTFHDVSDAPPRIAFLPESYRLSVRQKVVESMNIGVYGHWERHGMAQYFDEKILNELQVENETYRLQIFDSLFGFGVVLNKSEIDAIDNY